MFKKLFHSIILVGLLLGAVLPVPKGVAAEGIELYTPYTGISVTPGETIDYSMDVINHTSSNQSIQVSMNELLPEWEYTINSGGWDLQEISVQPGESESLSVNITVPLQVEKGTYTFKAVAEANSGLETELPLSVTVSEKGTFKTEMTTEQSNLEGDADSSFDYTAEIKNRTAEEQHYALIAEAPKGWTVDFEVDGKSVTSITVDSNATKNVKVSVSPATNVKSDTYQIPVRASNESTSAELVLEAAITGSYGIELSTPSGRLSEDITAGDEKTIDLVVKNTGTLPLQDISLTSSKPANWEVTFDPKKINKLEPGKSETIQATIKASKNAIAGDYVVEMEATAPESSSSAQFRMSVKTSMLWGWIGVFIIAGVIGGIFYLIRKYGRR
ncbi:NEW3 domain-containing protein [Bacillus carboniphilus]|uniref:NEW3 domain-containing protein n=1 Tax=Bacillus carboniphilus TaxID=86663 RepID=A0ABN0W5U7_9BACI